MIEIEFPSDELVVLRPEGALSEADFERLNRSINDHINRTDVVPNLMVRPRGIPHWASLAAMQRHIGFVKDHHKLVKKLAIVGDIGLLAALPPLVDLFVGARIRHFPEAKLEDAQDWLAAEEDHPGRFEPIDGLPGDVIGLRAIGIITAQDYRDTLLPLVEEKLKVHDKLKFLLVVGDEFTSYAPDAAWEDARFGIGHWSDFGRIAVVTDLGWLRGATRVFAPLMPCEVRVFALDELDEATSWIKR